MKLYLFVFVVAAAGAAQSGDTAPSTTQPVPASAVSLLRAERSALLGCGPASLKDQDEVSLEFDTCQPTFDAIPTSRCLSTSAARVLAKHPKVPCEKVVAIFRKSPRETPKLFLERADVVALSKLGLRDLACEPDVESVEHSRNCASKPKDVAAGLGGLGAVRPSGPDVDLGPVGTFGSTLEVSGSLSKAAINAGIQQLIQKAVPCKDTVAVTTNERHPLKVVATIARDGQVESIDITGPKPEGEHSRQLQDCVRGAMTGVNFPASRGKTTAKFPLIFQLDPA